MTKRYQRFSDISTSERILNTVFLLTIGLAYIMALINMYYTHQGRDGKPGLSIEDIVIMYHGSSNQTRLGSAITGIMLPNLKYKTDKEVILKWIHDGAERAGYQQDIAPILNRDCVHCHNRSVNPSLPDLTQYEGVAEVAHAGGATLPVLVRGISHPFVRYCLHFVFHRQDFPAL